MSKIISWCLFVERLDRLPEYLAGLKCNQRAARRWFPGWELWLYIDESVKKNLEVYEFVNEVAEFGFPEIKLIDCHPNANPMIQRYRPVYEKDSIFIVRDLDSILSKADADLVNEWVGNEQSDILRYQEYMMSSCLTMGGGYGLKTKSVNVDIISFDYQNHRGEDELFAEKITRQIPNERHTIIKTRMLVNGIYCLNEPKKTATILWGIPFFYNDDGCYENYTRGYTLEKLVEICREFEIKREHCGFHYFHFREKIMKNTYWFR
jgi:hypothetical protein